MNSEPERTTENGLLPPEFQSVLKREFVPYSVALGRVVGDDASSFNPLGAGTIVQKGGRLGILTAHHCLHALRPEVSLGPNGTDTLALVLRGGRSVILRPEEVFEHPLAHPAHNEYGPFGPDLSFLEVVPGPRRETILAVGSVWNLDKNAEDIARDFGQVGCLLAHTGIPELKSDTIIKEHQISRLAHHETLINSIGEGDIEEREGWDYITSVCDYAGSPTLVESLKGFSGGGIWSMQLGKDTDGVISIKRSALVGVSFYQGERIGDTRTIRGHFANSIYARAWQSIA